MYNCARINIKPIKEYIFYSNAKSMSVETKMAKTKAFK